MVEKTVSGQDVRAVVRKHQLGAELFPIEFSQQYCFHFRRNRPQHWYYSGDIDSSFAITLNNEFWHGYDLTKPAYVAAVEKQGEREVVILRPAHQLALSFPLNMPTAEQHSGYRKRISEYVAQLPIEKNKQTRDAMRALVARRWGGAAPHDG